jgi:hypothetical protein
MSETRSLHEAAEPHRKETKFHEFLDELRFVLRVVLVLFSFITLVLLMTEQHMALVSAVTLTVLFGIFVLIDLGERRLRPRNLGRVHSPPIDEVPEVPIEPPPASEDIAPARAEPPATSAELSPPNDVSQQPTEDRSVEKAEIRTGFRLAAGIGIIAIGLAALLLGWRMIGIGALLFFAYLALFGAPFWIAAVHQEGDSAKKPRRG